MCTAKCSGKRKSSNWLIFRSSADRILADDPAHLVGEVHRDRRKDVMPGAALEQQLDDGALRVGVGAVPARRPADRFELVIVAVADRIDAGIEEPSHHVDVSGGGSPMQRRGVIAVLERVHVEAAIEQQVDDVEMAALRGDMQQRPCVRRIADGQLRRVGVERRTLSPRRCRPGRLEESAGPPP